jgi:hypothetical protein
MVAAACAALAGAAGCARDREARYVYRDGQYGVIGIPKNTAEWHHRAEKLMTQHFPGGYDIVREEEIDSGTRKADLETKRSAGIKPGAGMSQFLIGLGESQRSSEQKYSDETKLHESRIIYRSRTPTPEPGFSLASTLTPEMYADPNSKSRHGEADKPLLAEAKAKVDPAVKKAADEGH